MNVDYPLHVDGRGRTAATDLEEHVRDLIEQVLFTSPGERVNRPDFGAGLNQLVFAPNSVDLAGGTELLVQASLQQWLGDVIFVEGVEVLAAESALRIRVAYVVRRSGMRLAATFERKVPVP